MMTKNKAISEEININKKIKNKGEKRKKKIYTSKEKALFENVPIQNL